MTIDFLKKGTELTVSLSGRLDTNTSPELDLALKDELINIYSLKLNLKDLDYISSAGLRVILVLHKTLTKKGGSLVILKPKDEVLDVFDMTGFSTFLQIED